MLSEGMFFCWDRKTAAVACRRNKVSCDVKYYQRSQKDSGIGVLGMVPGFMAALNVVMAFCNLRYSRLFQSLCKVKKLM